MWVRRADPLAEAGRPKECAAAPVNPRASGENSSPARARGVALVTVLLVLAILTAMAGRLGFSNQLWLRQVGNGADFLQSALSARAVQDWAGIILVEDDNDYDSLRDAWAQPLAPLPIGRGHVRGHMEDMQARINLNTLLDENGAVDRGAVRRFKRLLRILELNPGIADAVVDWMDDDADVSGHWGAEDGHYLGMNPPYVAANRRFRDTGELRLVRGVDGNAWHKLNPYVSALPDRNTAINVNTASPQVLAAAVGEWGSPLQALVEAAQWSGKATKEPFATVRDLYRAAGLEYDSDEPPAGLGVRSKYFLARTRVDAGNARRLTATLYRRDAEHARVLGHWREFD